MPRELPPSHGIPDDCSISEIDDEMKCMICCCLVWAPLQTPCNHLFCKVCLQRWLARSAQCPKCKQAVDLISCAPLAEKNPVVHRILGRYKLNCSNKNAKSACDWTGVYMDLPAHLLLCSFQLVGCASSGCSQVSPRSDINLHETSCPYRLCRCVICSQEVEAYQMAVCSFFIFFFSFFLYFFRFTQVCVLKLF
eukprot:GHVL01027859.1.p1 GENE.GHVL01027859.1~~GHVL01027859.1.p1  ORF type:complete len:194 (+),score=18.48 GHVL01027859.1:28-609(+)